MHAVSYPVYLRCCQCGRERQDLKDFSSGMDRPRGIGQGASTGQGPPKNQK
jgi:hypothetical protein